MINRISLSASTLSGEVLVTAVSSGEKTSQGIYAEASKRQDSWVLEPSGSQHHQRYSPEIKDPTPPGYFPGTRSFRANRISRL
jgi:hypothetical protein